jgi:hypothetical protein
MDLVFKEESFRIIGACFEVYKETAFAINFGSFRFQMRKFILREQSAASMPEDVEPH